MWLAMMSGNSQRCSSSLRNTVHRFFYPEILLGIRLKFPNQSEKVSPRPTLSQNHPRIESITKTQ
ncbi:MAG: hypothetical protein ACI814_001143 [Mariniblastus sp.]|jgi:hypothetical protein